MAVTLTWGIEKLVVLQSPKADFVTEIWWSCKGTDSDTYKVQEKVQEFDGDDEDGNPTYKITIKEVDVPYTEQKNGELQNLEESESFTPFADLTESQVVGWAKNILGATAVELIEQSVNDGITLKKNPSTIPVQKDLPW